MGKVWMEKLRNVFIVSSFEQLVSAAKYVCGQISREGERYEARCELLGISLFITCERGDLKVSYSDPLSSPHHLAIAFWVFVNAFERGARNAVFQSSSELVSMAAIAGDVLRGYEERFAQNIASAMGGAARSDIEGLAGLLGGRTVEHLSCDWALEFQPFAMTRIRVAHWPGDQEIRPHVSIMYGAEVKASGMPVEDLKALTAFACVRLVAGYGFLKMHGAAAKR